MIEKIALNLFIIMMLQGCAYSVYTKKLNEPIIRTPPQLKYYSSFDIRPEGEKFSSIGDELFRINRYEIGRKEYIAFRAPTSRDFVANAIWKGTHIYNDGKSGDLTVYTTPLFYNSQIGVILDSKEQLATSAPLVQLVGAKIGRRWTCRGSGKFFKLSNKLIENWGIRYGGISGESYTFELFNKNEAKIVEILQSIKISKKDFLEGFTVRGVLIQGLQEDNRGIIKYKIQDTEYEIN